MASNPDFVQYIADQCAGAGEITVKKMFGDYGIYCNGVIIGLKKDIWKQIGKSFGDMVHVTFCERQ